MGRWVVGNKSGGSNGLWITAATRETAAREAAAGLTWITAAGAAGAAAGSGLVVAWIILASGGAALSAKAWPTTTRLGAEASARTLAITLHLPAHVLDFPHQEVELAFDLMESVAARLVRTFAHASTPRFGFREFGRPIVFLETIYYFRVQFIIADLGIRLKFVQQPDSLVQLGLEFGHFLL